MPLNRKIVGTEKYEGANIVVRFLGPDLLCEVDGVELGGFYSDVEAAKRSGRKYVDDIHKAIREAKQRDG